MPYQEEPRDIPNRFVIDAPVDPLKQRRIPIVIAGSVEGRAAARATYDRILGSVKALCTSARRITTSVSTARR